MILKMPLKLLYIYLEFQATQLKDNPIPHDIPGKMWETVGADIFMLNNKTYLCIVDYHSKFLVWKLMNGSHADSLRKSNQNM